MFSTRDLPESMRADFTDANTIRAVRRSGLRFDLECKHGRTDCSACLSEAARQLSAELDQPVS
jgi:hypothetical protein